MKISMKKESGCRQIITIEVPADVVDQERNETVKLYTKHANLPGFRKGKAPAHVVAGKYAKEIDQDIKERLLPKYYQEAIQEKSLKVVNVIDASEMELKEQQPATFSVTVDLVPEFKLPKYEGIPLKVTEKEVKDSDVEEQLQTLLNQQSTYEDVEGKAIAAGDMGQLTYTAYVGEQPLKEAIEAAKGLGAGEGYWVSADEHAFIPGMGEALVGLNIGDKKSVDVHFPAGFMVNELADIKARYEIEVTGVRERRAAELNQEFLDKLQVESEEKLRELMREQLELQADNEVLRDKHDQIVAYLIKKTKIEAPESALQEQTRNVMYELARQKMMTGMSQEQIGEEQEALFKEAQTRAEENVKLRFIGLAIADAEELDCSAQEVEEEIMRMAMEQRKPAAELRKELEENQSLSAVSDQLRFNKALALLVEKAKIK